MELGRSRAVKKSLAGIAIVAGLAAGCATEQKPPAADLSASALDVTTTPAAAPAPEPMPLASATPVSSQSMAAPDTVMTQTPSAASSAGGSSYVIKKGDTLYKLAKEHYGDGKQWQRIASANPGVTPQSLKIGQTLIIP
jgi:5'-nucleotidase/UDP-sugar diphosphatase